MINQSRRSTSNEIVNQGHSGNYPSILQLTTCDVVERALKKGKGGEVEAGARLGVLLALQLPDPEPVYTELRSVVANTGL